MERLLYELIRVSIGVQDSLSRTPSPEEWTILFKMARRQAIAGVCFIGAQNLPVRMRPPQHIYLQWMALAARTQELNEILDRRCAELRAILAESGIRSSVLKGQGAAARYGELLREFRQSGDIDMYVDCGLEQAIRFARSRTHDNPDWDYKHLHLKIFDDVPVEMHYRAEVMFNLFHNARFQRWTRSAEVQGAIFGSSEGGFVCPEAGFNLVHMLVHMNHHVMSEGLGLRQFMDYYFTLLSTGLSDEVRQETMKTLRHLGLTRFAAGVMWVLGEVFALPGESMLCSPDATAGRFILDDVLRGGNFGKYDSGRRPVRRSVMPLRLLADIFRRDIPILFTISAEALWYPVWVTFHFFWKRIWRLTHNNLFK